MLKRTTKLLVAIAIIGGIVGYASNAHSNAAGCPAGYCGVPGENTCAASGCHDGQAAIMKSSRVQVWLTRDFGGTKARICTKYVPDSTYIVNVQLLNTPTGSTGDNGFQNVIVDHTLYGKGTTGFMTTNLGTVINAAGGCCSKTYMEQCNGSCVTGTTDGTKPSGWQYTWKAPSSNSGTLIIYTCALKKNGLGRKYDSTFCRVDSLPYAVGLTDVNTIGLDKYMNTYANNNVLHIKYAFDNAKEVSFDVYDIYGNRVYGIDKTTSINANHDINVSGWPKGVYVVRGIVGGETWARKIVLQ